MTSDRGSSNFASHAATYALGNIAGRLVGFLMLPIYTRYLTAADYGAVGLLTFALALLEPLFGARLGRAIPKFYFDAADERARRAILWGALILTSSVSAITAVLIVLLRVPASQILFGSHKYALATGLFAVNMICVPIEDTGMMYLRLQEHSRLFLKISVGKLFLQVLLNLLFVVYWRLNVVGVVLGGIVSSLVVGIGLTTYIAVRNAPVLEWKTMARMLKFCWPLWLSGIAGLYIGSSGAVYLRLFDSLSDVGLLELALRFATVASALVWTPFFQHWEPMSYRYYKEAGGREKFQAAFVTMSVLLFVGGLGVSIFAEPVIRVMAAAPFHAAAHVVPVLTLGLTFNSLVAFFRFGFLVTDRTKLASIAQYVTAVVITIAYFALIPRYGLEGAACAQCLAFAVNFTHVYFWSRRYHDPGFDFVLIGILVLVGASAFVCANVFLHVRSLGADLITKSAILLAASFVMALVGMRAIRQSSPSVYESIQLSLRRLGRRGFAR